MAPEPDPDPPPLPEPGVRLKSRIDCDNAALVTATKFVSPLYIAVMEWGPSVRDEVVSVATPAESVTCPSGVVPSRKLTVPVGVPTVEIMLAVNVTAVCATAGLLIEDKRTDGVNCAIVMAPVAEPA